jgi:hypothetical protein
MSSIQRVYTDNAGTQFTYTETVPGSGDGPNIISESVATAQTNVPFLGFVADRSQLTSLMLHSTRNITLYTNDLSSGSPQDTIALVALVMKEWSLAKDGISACPFSNDVDSLYLTNASGGTAVFNLRMTSDPVA